MPSGLRPLTAVHEVEEHILALHLPFQQIVHLDTVRSLISWLYGAARRAASTASRALSSAG